MHVLYLSGKRAREVTLLESLKNRGELYYAHFRLNSRSSIAGLEVPDLRALVSWFRDSRFGRPDVILTEGPGWVSLVGLALKYAYGVPIGVRVKGDLWSEFGEREHRIALHKRLVKHLNYYSAQAILRYAEALLPISEHINKMIGANVRKRKRTYIVHIPYKTDIAVEREGCRGCADGEPFVLSVTNFNFWKKVEPLLTTVNRTCHLLEQLGVRWLILGEGMFRDRFQKGMIPGAKERVQVLGYRDPRVFYKAAKGLFHISGMDGLPNVILEASRSKVPIVMNAGCPAAEFIIDGVTGVLLDISDERMVADVMTRLAINHGYGQALGEAAFKSVTERFSVERVSEQLLVALESLVRGA